MTTTTTHRIRVAKRLPKHKILALLALAKAIYQGMLGNPALFPSPNPSLAVLLALIMALETAQVTVGTRVRGAAAVRDVKRNELVTALESEAMYIQALCDASPELAMTLIKAAAMDASKRPVFAKPILQVQQGTQPGSVILVANGTLLIGRGVRKKALFNWQMSVDGKTWSGLPATPLASTSVAGLTSLTTYAFRVSVTVAKVTGEWSQAVTIGVR